MLNTHDRHIYFISFLLTWFVQEGNTLMHTAAYEYSYVVCASKNHTTRLSMQLILFISFFVKFYSLFSRFLKFLKFQKNSKKYHSNIIMVARRKILIIQICLHML